MRTVLLAIAFFSLSIATSIAQSNSSVMAEEQNYKHSHKPEEDYKNGMFTSDTVISTDQKTQRRTSGKHVLAPCDSVPATNVQGKKYKANYKNQFN